MSSDKDIVQKTSEVLRKALSEFETGAKQMEQNDRRELQIVNTGGQSRLQIQSNATEEFIYVNRFQTIQLIAKAHGKTKKAHSKTNSSRQKKKGQLLDINCPCDGC